jgi:hypothetical protein
MNINEKIANAKPTTWVTDGIPKWKVFLIIRFARLKAKIQRRKRGSGKNE